MIYLFVLVILWGYVLYVLFRVFLDMENDRRRATVENAKTTEPINPCPLCEAEAKIVYQEKGNRESYVHEWHIQCTKCGLKSPSMGLYSVVTDQGIKQSLVKKWNAKKQIGSMV